MAALATVLARAATGSDVCRAISRAIRAQQPGPHHLQVHALQDQSAAECQPPDAC